jgi:hypothetical protein
MTSLLADVVASRSLPPEPVATDALVHLLSRSLAGRMAMLNFIESICPNGGIGPLSFASQVISEGSDGRPDIVGFDDTGVRLVIEAKFDAELTPAQLGTAYLDHLHLGLMGALVYLVPSDRLPSIWPRILKGPGQAGSESVISIDYVGKDLLRHELPDGRVLAAVSWRSLIEILRHPMESANDKKGLGDLAQIEGLVNWRSRTGWTPLLPGDLPERAGRQLAALRDSLLAAAAQASGEKVKNGSSDSGPGRWISSPAGRWFWTGIWFPGWGRYGLTPAWVTIRPQTGESLAAIEGVMAHLPTQNSGMTSSDGRLEIPLLVPPGVEQGEVIGSLVVQLRAIGEALDTLATAPVSDPQSEADLEA